MTMPDYYADPVDDWMMCVRCKTHPAFYVVNAGADAGLHVYCESCMPANRRPWAQPYTPWRNQEIENRRTGFGGDWSAGRPTQRRIA
jgi:hypothetical protein